MSETTARGAYRFRQPLGPGHAFPVPAIAAGFGEMLGSEVSPDRRETPKAGTKLKLYDSSYDVKR